jgi:tRNA-specific 2-thiouridylase
MFPIGDMLKPNLRKVAKEAGLPTADKKDSQGLCFIGKVRLPEFLQQKLSIISGDIIEIDRGHEVFSIDKDDSISKRAEPFNLKPELGKKVGNHQGAHFYTIGQRKGLNIGGNPEPIFVIGTDVKSNTVYVGQGDKHPGLLRRALKVNTKDIHWVLPSHTLAVGQTSRYSLRFRYRQPLQSGEIVMTSEGLYLKFDEPQRGIAAGQFAVWYDGEKLVGSGPISA